MNKLAFAFTIVMGLLFINSYGQGAQSPGSVTTANTASTNKIPAGQNGLSNPQVTPYTPKPHSKPRAYTIPKPNQAAMKAKATTTPQQQPSKN